LGTPILLSCCGATVCVNHVEEDQSEIYECPLCLTSHDMQSKQFATNKVAEDLLKMEIEQLSFGLVYEEAEKECNTLRSSLRKLSDLTNDPKFYIYEVVSKLKNKVDLRREELKVDIDKLSNTMIEKLKTFERECYENLNDLRIQSLITTIESLVDLTQSNLNELDNGLKRLVIDEPKWKETQLNAKTMDVSVLGYLEQLKADLLMNKQWTHKVTLKLNEAFSSELILFENKETIEFELKDFGKIFNQSKETNTVESKKYLFSNNKWSIVAQTVKYGDEYVLGIALICELNSCPVRVYSNVYIASEAASRKKLSIGFLRDCINTTQRVATKRALYSIKTIMDADYGLYDAENDKVTIKAEFYC
jgi:hypothetical protein